MEYTKILIINVPEIMFGIMELCFLNIILYWWKKGGRVLSGQSFLLVYAWSHSLFEDWCGKGMAEMSIQETNLGEWLRS